MKKNKELGQFYTLGNISDYLVKIIKDKLGLFLNFDNIFFLEPSAGTGSFIKSLNKIGINNILGYDIEPLYNGIIKKDFLNDSLEELDNIKNNNKTILTIGNPPFGKKSDLAIKFFNKSAEYSDFICFIVPNQFCKYSVQSKLNKSFKLIYEEDLPNNSFFIDTEEKKKYNVNCVFQIWVNNSFFPDINDLRINSKPNINHEDFYIYQYNRTNESLKYFDFDFDFGVLSQGYGNYNEKIFKKEDFNFKKQRTLFKAKNKKTLDNLLKIDFEKLSKKNTTIPGFRKSDIVKEYILNFNS